MSARADALNRLNSNYRVYTEVLQLIAEDPLQKKATQSEVYSLIKALTKLETGFLTAFWSCILKRTNMTSKLLQSETASLGSSVSLLQSLNLSRCYERETSSKSLLRWGINSLDLYIFLRNKQSTSNELPMTEVLKMLPCSARKNSEYLLSW